MSYNDNCTYLFRMIFSPFLYVFVAIKLYHKRRKISYINRKKSAVYAYLGYFTIGYGLIMFGECKDEQLMQDMCNAAIGHDLIEDTDVTEDDIVRASNRRVLGLIKELTNPIDDDHTEQYMEQLKVASEEARLIKYADLVENTISVCYNFHIVGEEWAYNFYRAIMYRTLSVLEETEFPIYPRTAEFLHSMLKVYIRVLNNKNLQTQK